MRIKLLISTQKSREMKGQIIHHPILDDGKGAKGKEQINNAIEDN